MFNVALIVQLLYLSGACLTIAKLLKTGLCRHYPILTWYAGFCVADSIWPLLLSNTSQVYLKFYVCRVPVSWVLSILVVREIYRLILGKHRGIDTLGRWPMYVSVAIAVSLSFLTLLPKIRPAMPQPSRVMGYVVAIERGVDLSLALFILLMLVFLSLYPVPLTRNVLVHAVVYSIFFLSSTLAMFLRTIFGLQLQNIVNAFLMAASTACMFAWFLLLSPKGEKVRVNLPWLPPEQESRLLTQLDALNATLLKASRN